MDSLPNELLHLIAENNMATYCGLVQSYPRFARLITNGIRFDYAIAFGIDYHVKSYQIGHTKPCLVGTWTLNGKAHRADGPAKIWFTKYYYQIQYHINGQLHRMDGPAIIHDDDAIEYYVRNKCHRIGGPAYIRADGTEIHYINDVYYTPKEYQKLILSGAYETPYAVHYI